MIEIGKNYTPKELEQIYGSSWRSIFKLDTIPMPQKSVINNFEEFDQETKNIYTQIYNYILELNYGQDFKVYATGSRVKGYWRTVEEAQQLSEQYDRYVKPSDYDFWTTAPKIPTKQQFFERVGVHVDFNKGDKQVLIEP